MDPEVFLDLYNNLETKLKGRGSYYNDRYESPIIRFSNSSEGKEYREELSTIRDIRNLLVHSPLVNGKYPVEPSDEIGAVLEEILEKVEQPKKAMNYATWADKIQKTRLDEEAYPVMRMMELRGFSHVPVVEGRCGNANRSVGGGGTSLFHLLTFGVADGAGRQIRRHIIVELVNVAGQHRPDARFAPGQGQTAVRHHNLRGGSAAVGERSARRSKTASRPAMSRRGAKPESW